MSLSVLLYLMPVADFTLQVSSSLGLTGHWTLDNGTVTLDVLLTFTVSARLVRCLFSLFVIPFVVVFGRISNLRVAAGTAAGNDTQVGYTPLWAQP